MPLSDNYDILLTLFLPDVYADWDVESSSIVITEWMERMSPFANFTLTSQIIYHPGDIGINSSPAAPDEGTVWLNSDLSNVINALEWHLQSNQNPNSKLVQLVAFVPPMAMVPLSFKSSRKREKTFIILNNK